MQPIKLIDFNTFERQWDENEDDKKKSPKFELLEKDISGCNMAYNLAMAKILKKMQDAIMSSQNDEEGMSAADQMELKRDSALAAQQASDDYRKCLATGKSMATALGEEFMKGADDFVKDQISAIVKEVQSIRE